MPAGEDGLAVGCDVEPRLQGVPLKEISVAARMMNPRESRLRIAQTRLRADDADFSA